MAWGILGVESQAQGGPSQAQAGPSQAQGGPSNVEGRAGQGSKESHIHDSIKHVQLSRSVDAEIARKMPKKQTGKD